MAFIHSFAHSSSEGKNIYIHDKKKGEKERVRDWVESRDTEWFRERATR